MAKAKTKKTRYVLRAVLGVMAVLGLVGILIVIFKDANIPVLMPKGIIAEKERQLVFIAVALSMIVVIPVFIMLFVIAWRYREQNTKATYSPDWDSNKWIETLWWGVPLVIITILGVITWQSSHELDPFKPLSSATKPVKIEVVALQWKWLFIYPDYGVASVNEVSFPAHSPIDFEITADAPMNSFWIPSLGSQVYAMTGMSTQLHLQADQEGTYPGRSANISGEGFADMSFSAVASSQKGFDEWVKQAKQSGKNLDAGTYASLAKPGSESAPSFYTLKQTDLYDTIVMKYMGAH